MFCVSRTSSIADRQPLSYTLQLQHSGCNVTAGSGLTHQPCNPAGLERGSGADAAASLACYYPLSKDRTLRADRRLTAPRKAEYKWWPDGYEPLYYVVTPRVRSMCCAVVTPVVLRCPQHAGVRV